MPERVNESWTIAKLKKVAKPYKGRRQFALAEPSAYRTAARRGILDEVCKHMKPAQLGRPKLRPPSKKTVLEAASTCLTVKEFADTAPIMYRHAMEMNLMDKIKEGMKARRKAG